MYGRVLIKGITMLDKIIKYRNEMTSAGKNSDSLDGFVLWVDKKNIKN